MNGLSLMPSAYTVPPMVTVPQTEDPARARPTLLVAYPAFVAVNFVTVFATVMAPHLLLSPLPVPTPAA